MIVDHGFLQKFAPMDQMCDNFQNPSSDEEVLLFASAEETQNIMHYVFLHLCSDNVTTKTFDHMIPKKGSVL